MKIVNTTLALLLLAGLATSCSELDDKDYYSDTDSKVLNDELKITNLSSEEYIKSRADFSSMNELFEKDSIYSRLDAKGQVSTMLVVSNDNFKQPEASREEYIAKSHVSDIAISPANMHNGERLMMWHGKYVNIDIDSLGQKGHVVDHIMLNNAAVKEVIKTNNGFVYVISDMISTPTSLYDFINNLDDNYSLFKDMVLSSGERIFDKANSKAIGVNNEGNTVYDSVFIYKNSFFEAKGFDMNSESLTATMLLFSNDVINEAMNDAKQRLASWGLERNQDTLRHWILKAAFFNKKYEADEIQTTDTNDLQSIYGMQWRTNVQKVDVANPTELSNGVVYKVKKLHLPTNLLIYRLKDYFYYYENCTDEEKDSYFKTFNMTYNGCKTEVAEWTPWAGVWPLHENRILRYDKTEGVDDSQGFQIDFTPIMLSANGDVTPYKIPPGTYRLAMGFVQNMGVDIKVEVLVNGKIIATSPSITLGSATTYHYDRGAVLDNRYPEGFEPNYVRSKSGNKKAANYDTDGGPIISELNIPDVKGDGSASTITLRIVSDNWGGKTMVKLHHWCLRPTSNNY